MHEAALDESVWARATREMRRRCLSFRFLASELALSPAVGFAVDPIAGGFLALGILLGVFLFSLWDAPRQQRNDARQAVKAFQRDDDAVDLARQLRGVSHGFTTILRARAARWVAQNGPIGAEAEPQWERKHAGDASYRLETLALVQEGYREALLKLLDAAKDHKAVEPSEFRLAVRQKSVDHWWGLRDVVNRVSRRLTEQESRLVEPDQS